MKKMDLKYTAAAAGQGPFENENSWMSTIKLTGQKWLFIHLHHFAVYPHSRTHEICVNVPIYITHAADWLYSKTLLGQTWFCSDDCKKFN